MQPAQNETVPPRPPSVAVLLCSYQGEPHLAEQLDSIAAQSHRSWTVWVSDDGSTDGTLAILKRYQSLWGQTARMLRCGAYGATMGKKQAAIAFGQQPPVTPV